MTSKDEDLRARQRAAEAAADRRWEAVHDQSLANWDSVQMEIEFSIRMLKDGLDQKTIVGLLLKMRHHGDPGYLFTEGETVECETSVGTAQFILRGDDE